MDADEQAAERQKAHLDGLYAQIFEDDKRGAAILNDLHDQFVIRPNRRDFTQEGVLRTFVQTHQREVIEYIHRRCNAARGVKDQPPPEGSNDV